MSPKYKTHLTWIKSLLLFAFIIPQTQQAAAQTAISQAAVRNFPCGSHLLPWWIAVAELWSVRAEEFGFFFAWAASGRALLSLSAWNIDGNYLPLLVATLRLWLSGWFGWHLVTSHTLQLPIRAGICRAVSSPHDIFSRRSSSYSHFKVVWAALISISLPRFAWCNLSYRVGGNTLFSLSLQLNLWLIFSQANYTVFPRFIPRVFACLKAVFRSRSCSEAFNHLCN